MSMSCGPLTLFPLRLDANFSGGGWGSRGRPWMMILFSAGFRKDFCSDRLVRLILKRGTAAVALVVVRDTIAPSVVLIQH